MDKWFKGGTFTWPLPTVLRVASMVLESLKFIHDKGYTHNDVKAQNLLVGLDTEDKDVVYLVDFGLACKYRDAFGFHCEEEPDERKAHDGTLEYTSRDAHTGAHSRRGDLETLGYNMVHWAAGNLPWMGELEDPEKVGDGGVYWFIPLSRWKRARKLTWRTSLDFSPNALMGFILLFWSSFLNMSRT